MPVFDSTGTLDSSMYLKAKLDKNRVGENYYIKNLQDIRNRDWYSRYNVVGIEEELHKQIQYTIDDPIYTPIDVAIRTVKSETGEDLGTDWADIAFKDLFHPNDLGCRYRFSTEFPNMDEMTEEQKHYDTSIWIAVNKNPISAGNNCIIRRCNSNIAFVGSPTLNYNDITEIHYEPIVLENDLKYINMYYNMTVVIPQSEWYATMQLNYFTNSIQINDRVIFGGVDLTDKENNAVYKVKAVVKASALNTFTRDGSLELDKIPLCLLALDKDVIAPNRDDFYRRVAERAPLYLVENNYPTYQYYISLFDAKDNGEYDASEGSPCGRDSNYDELMIDSRNSLDNRNNLDNQDYQNEYNSDDSYNPDNTLENTYENRILLNQENTYVCYLMWNNEIAQNGNTIFNITSQLVKIEEKDLDAQRFNENMELNKNYEYNYNIDRVADIQIIETPIENEGEYYSIDIIGNNKFTIKNYKTCTFGKLKVTCICENPDDETSTLSQDFYFELGGFY